MTKQKKAEIFLFLTTFIWGGNCVITKFSLYGITPLRLIAIRFLIASLIALPFFMWSIPTFNRVTLKNGCWLGLLMFIGFVAQTVGLVYTSASHSAFITSMMVIFTPIFQWILLQQKLSHRNLIGIVIVLIGLWFLTAPHAEGFNIGDGLTLLCAAIFGFYLIELDRISKQCETPSQLAFLQIASCAVYAWMIVWPFESSPMQWHENICHTEHVLNCRTGWTQTDILSMGYLVVFATLATTFTQIRYQRDTTPTRAAIIFTVEPVWAAILGYLMLGERLGLSGLLGGGLIVAGIFISLLPKKI